MINSGTPATFAGIAFINTEEGDADPEENYSYFAETVGFSKKVIDALLESGGVRPNASNNTFESC